jgi:cytochrome c oxidase assembly factor CtaG
MYHFMTTSSALLQWTMLLHPQNIDIAPTIWQRAWSWEFGIVIPLVLTAVLYAMGSIRSRRRNELRPAIKTWQIASFWVGWTVLVLSLDSPLHKLGEVLFSAHMTQHELLMVVAAPLLVFSKPIVAMLFALPQRWRIRLGRISKSNSFQAIWMSITGPLVVWMIHGATIWLWHIPVLYEATLGNEFIHALQHMSFLGTALLFWWTLVHGRYGKLGYGVAFIYVFTTALHTSLLGALMTFTPKVWYPIYEGRTAPWNLTPLEDQQLGGLIMWIPSGVVFVVVGLAMLGAWIGESERRQPLSKIAGILDSEGSHAD